MNYFLKCFMIVLATQLAILGLLWFGQSNFGPISAFVYVFYFMPFALVIGITIELIPSELIDGLGYGIYIYGFGVVIIFYSLIGAAIAHFVRNFRRPILQGSIVKDD